MTSGPAIVGLNEIETFSPRTRFANQPKRLAGARDMVFCCGLTVLSTHLGLDRSERAVQIAELKRIVKAEKDQVILMGDFNCGTDQLAPLDELLTDTGELFGSRPTYPDDNPTDRIDYILISPQIICLDLSSPFSDASDHLPVMAELELLKPIESVRD